jgi:tetratricopeptide (TPR) repeat protein
LLKTAKILVCCLILIPLGGSVQTTARNRGAERSAQARALSGSLQHGEQLFRQGRYQEAATVFHAVEEDSRSQGLSSISVRALGNLGACELLLRQFQTALQTLVEARRRAELERDSSTAALIETNIASVYVQIGEYNAAADWVQRSIARLSGRDRASHLARLQLQLAALRGLQGRMAEALERSVWD